MLRAPARGVQARFAVKEGEVSLDTSAPDIIIDSREASKVPGVVEWLKRVGLKVEVKPLPAGDYLLNAAPGRKRLIVERKTPTDLVEAFKGRLWEQLELLKSLESETTDIAIAIEGYLPLVRKLTKWSETSVARLLDEIALSWRIPVIPCPDRKWFVRWLAAKAKDLGKPEEKVEHPLRTTRKRKLASLNDRILYVMQGVCGAKTARALLKKFKTIKGVANASPSELMVKRLVGEKKAKEIWEIFNTEWKPEDESLKRE